MGGGGVKQRPDEEDGVDSHESLADGSGICEVADHRLDARTWRSLMAHEASDAHAVCSETVDDLSAEVAGRAGDQYR
ncbi:hypothetical protein GCM10010187_39790 [Actinomadura coerulea]|nr:hypothetical protein GCM10010187_39790 [Actinomadura coerulea]